MIYLIYRIRKYAQLIILYIITNFTNIIIHITEYMSIFVMYSSCYLIVNNFWYTTNPMKIIYLHFFLSLNFSTILFTHIQMLESTFYIMLVIILKNTYTILYISSIKINIYLTIFFKN